MNPSYICWRCNRHHFLRPRSHSRRANFVSLNNIPRHYDSIKSSTYPTTTERASAVRANDEISIRRRIPASKRDDQHESLVKQQEDSSAVDRILETLNASDKSQPRQQPRTYQRLKRRPSFTAATKFDKGSIIQQLQDLQTQLNWETASLESIWHSCCGLLHGRSRSSPEWDEIESHPAFNVLRDIALAIATSNDFTIQGTTFDASDAIHTYLRHGIPVTWWDEALWASLGNLLTLDIKEKDSRGKQRYEISRQKRRSYVQTIRLWKSFTSRDVEVDWQSISPSRISPGTRPIEEGHEAQTDNKFASLSEFIASTKDDNEMPRQLEQRFSRILPYEIPNVKSTAAAAAMTLHYTYVFKDESTINKHGFKSFIDAFQLLTDKAEMDVSEFQTHLKQGGLPSEILDSAMASWSRSLVDVVKAASSGSDSQSWMGRQSGRLLKRISDAMIRSDAGAIRKLWQETQTQFESQEAGDTSRRGEIYSRFLSAFFAIHQPNEAIQVWNHMVKIGQPIEQRHWTAMLSGSTFARDVVSLQRIWSNMLQAGVSADTETWTTYIYGLIKCKNWQQGIEALGQLGRQWKSDAAKTATPSTSKLTPSLGPVHGALSGLVQSNKLTLLPTILSWARSQGLTPTTYTYNILLRPVIRSGALPEIQNHLISMSTDSCPPDITTLTIILNGLVSNPTSAFHTLPPKEQQTTILTLLKTMATHSIHPNQHTYSTILDGLLSPRPPATPNIPAARAILNHMTSHNVLPSPHIYTILLTHYFTSHPPDLPAVASLWSSIKATPSTGVDTFFYDRMIEGYASCGEIEEAMAFLRRMPKEGKSPSWVAVGRVLEALERAREWELCGELVRGVEERGEGGLMRFQGFQGMGKGWEGFWGRVDELRGAGRI